MSVSEGKGRGVGVGGCFDEHSTEKTRKVSLTYYIIRQKPQTEESELQGKSSKQWHIVINEGQIPTSPGATHLCGVKQVGK